MIWSPGPLLVPFHFFLHLNKPKWFYAVCRMGGNGSSNTLISRFWLCFSEHSSHTYLYFIHSPTSPQLRRLQTRYFWIWAKLGYIDVLGMLIKQVMRWKSIPFNLVLPFGQTQKEWMQHAVWGQWQQQHIDIVILALFFRAILTYVFVFHSKPLHLHRRSDKTNCTA